jgi:heme-degrading monooxygenase HmoA
MIHVVDLTLDDWYIIPRITPRTAGHADMTSTTPFATTPEMPYYAVIFSSQRTEGDHGYGHAAERMLELASKQPGFIGIESARGADGFGITVSYWSSEEAIASWKAQLEHQAAQATGKRVWYAEYQIRVAKVERAYASGIHCSPSGQGM